EFAAGGLLALVGAGRVSGTVWGAVLAWLGLGGIVAAGVLYDGSSMFPGWIALLPVLGTVAVIAAGPSQRWWAPARWLSLRPATFVGDISYSVYLWHWPLIVVMPFVTGFALRTTDKVAIIVATLLVAWASKAWVEDP